MWMRKSDVQVARERNRVWLSFVEPAILFLICFLATIGIAIQGPRVAVVNWPDTWSEMLFESAIIATVVAIAGYVLQVVLRRKLSSLTKYGKIVICDTCHRVEHRDGESKCECGGTFDDFDKWTWIDGGGKGDGNTTGNSTRLGPVLTMKPPIFLDDSGDLNIFKSVESAEAYLEPEDMDNPGSFVYDSEGRLLKQVFQPSDNWLDHQLGLKGRRIRLMPLEEEPTHMNELAEKLTRVLRHRKYSDEQLRSEPLARLVELSLPYASKY